MTLKRILIAVVCLLAVTRPAQAQWVVIDPANLVQSILIAQRTLNEYQQIVEQYTTLYRMARGLAEMAAYRTRAIVADRHDLSRFPYGSPLLDALNSGDPAGERYSSVVRPLAALSERIPAGARSILEKPFAALQIADAVSQRAIHQTAMIRASADDLARAIGVLERDVLSPSSDYHSMTVNLDKLAGAELIGRRQDSATNQLMSHVVEQQLVKVKRMRDTEAAAMNMRINGLEHGAAAQQAVVAGSADALTTWRQP